MLKRISTQTYAIVGAFVVAILLIVGTISIIGQRGAAEEMLIPPAPPEPPVLQTPRPYVTEEGITELPAKHVFENGVHTFSGTVDKPGDCFELSTQADLVGDGVIALSFEMADMTGECNFALTPEDFSVSLEAPEDAEVQAEFNGVSLELIPLEGHRER